MKKKKEEVDEIDLFFDTMERTVKKFSVADKLLVKRKVFNIVSDVEGKYVGEEQPQRQQSYGQNIQYKNHSLTSFPQTTQENVLFNLTSNTQQQFISSQTSGPQINSYYDDTSNFRLPTLDLLLLIVFILTLITIIQVHRKINFNYNFKCIVYYYDPK